MSKLPEGNSLRWAVLELYNQFLSIDVRLRAVSVETDRNVVVAGWHQPTRAGDLRSVCAKKIDLIGKTHADKGTTLTSCAVNERSGSLVLTQETPHLADEVESATHKPVINCHINSSLRADVVDDATVTGIAVLAQYQCLRTHLNSLGVIRAFRIIGDLAVLVLNRGQIGTVILKQVESRRQSGARSREPQGTYVNLMSMLIDLACPRKSSSLVVYPTMLELPLHGVRVVDEALLSPLNAGCARTIGE
jgi:hypothetical protein